MAAPRKDNVKEKILDTTEILLKTKSLSDISLKQIAQECGVSKGTLYYHYKNKTDILFDITDRYLNTQLNDLISWTENKEKDTSISRLIKYIAERNTASAQIRFHLWNEAMLGNEAIKEKLIKRYSEFQKLISQKIAERTENIEPDYISWLILLACDGLIIQQVITNKSINVENYIKESESFIKNFK